MNNKNKKIIGCAGLAAMWFGIEVASAKSFRCVLNPKHASCQSTPSTPPAQNPNELGRPIPNGAPARELPSCQMQTENRSIVVNGQIRQYLWHKTNIPTQSAVLYFHGDGGSERDNNASNLAKSACARGNNNPPLIVSLRGQTNGNAWQMRQDQAGSPRDDVDFALAVMQTIKRELNIQKIGITGSSRGAVFNYVLMSDARTQWLIDAAAPHMGSTYCESTDEVCKHRDSPYSIEPNDMSRTSENFKNYTNPILHLHGTNDVVVPAPKSNSWYSPIGSWSGSHGCFNSNNNAPNDNVTLQKFGNISNWYGSGKQLIQYQFASIGANDCSKYQLWLLQGAGHNMPYPAKEVLQFFQEKSGI